MEAVQADESGTLWQGRGWRIAEGVPGETRNIQKNGKYAKGNCRAIQANLQRAKLATNELLYESQNRNISFALVQEPYVGADGELAQKRGYRVVQRVQNRTKPIKSAIIILDENLEVIEYPTLTTENIAVATLKTHSWEVCVVSIYFEDSLPIEPYLTHVKSIHEKLQSKNLIIGGDANAWSTWWGSETENHRGETLMGAVEEMEMHILNEGTTPTFFTIRNGTVCKSRVDITTCSQNLLGVVTDWKVDEGITSSDHNAITFTINLDQSREHKPIKSTRIYNTKKINWNQFSKELQTELENNKINTKEITKIKTDKELEDMIEKFTKSVTSACQIIPKIKRNTKINLPWWSPELDKLKKNMMTKKRRICCAAPRRRQRVVEEYLKEKEKYEKEATRAQIKSWKDFCCTQDRESLWDGIYRVIRRTSKPYEDQPLVNDGILLSLEKSTKFLAETFFPPDSEIDDNPEHKEVRIKSKISFNTTQNDNQDPVFTREELINVVGTFNPKKAPGKDGLTADICAKVILSNTEEFLAILNKCLELHHFPVPWKEAVVVVLRKPGKTDYQNVKSYRPIGLLPIFGKILEKMIVRRIRWHLLPKLNPRQYGFMPQRSTEDSLYDLVKHVKNNLEHKLISVVVSLDIEGAFDSAWWPAIKCQLAEKGCPKNIYRLVTSYLENRKVLVRYADHEHSIKTSKGCVQGSITGPTFWNVLLDPLLEGITQRKVYCQAFADDVVLVFTGHSVQKIEEEANRVLDYVHAWGVQNKLKFAPQKTSAMVITKKLKYETPHIRMANAGIDLAEEIKILGLIIDNKLTFNKHVKYVCTKALNIYKPLSRSAKISWGLSPEIIRTIYVSVIEPIVLYAASAWAPAANKQGVRKTLNSVQRGFAQKIIKAYRTVSHKSALILAGTLPLDLRIQEAAALYEMKRGVFRPWLGDREVEVKEPYASQPHPAKQMDLSFVSLMDQEQMEKQNKQAVRIYTDGSKIEGKVGAALSLWNNEAETKTLKLKLAPHCTVYQAELLALCRAASIAAKHKENTIGIYSDSRSSLESVVGNISLHPLVVNIRDNLRACLDQNKKVSLFWVKAHAGLEGNERADVLAREAALTLKRKPDYDRCPVSFVKRQLRKDSLDEWNRRYTSEESAGITKMFLPDVKLAYKFVRKTEISPLLTQVLTGHGGFAEYLHRFKCKDTPGCVCDDTEGESIVHMIMDCPQHGAAREDLQQELQMELCRGSIHTILANPKSRPLLIRFACRVASIAIKRNKSSNIDT